MNRIAFPAVVFACALFSIAALEGEAPRSEPNSVRETTTAISMMGAMMPQPGFRLYGWVETGITGNFDSPDETRTPDKTKVDVVRMGGTTVGRFAFEPGWKWSECVKPVAGTESCQARHFGVVQSGTLRVSHEDGWSHLPPAPTRPIGALP